MTEPSTAIVKNPALGLSAVLTLARAYRRLTFLGAAVFLLVVGLTVWGGWQRQVATELSLARQRVHASSIRLQAIVKSASDQVTQLATWSSHFPDHAPDPGPADVRLVLDRARKASPDGQASLDGLATRPPEQRLGQLLVLPGASQARPMGRPSDLDLALALVDRLGDGIRTSPFLRWTYFNAASRNVLVIAPWVTQKNLLGTDPDMHSFLQHSWNYEVASAGLPANNPRRQPYWTRAYRDQAGAGWMISHAAPVYWGDEFVGVVATDVLGGFLSDFLHEFPDKDGRLTISNEYGQILGDRQSPKAAQAGIASIDSVLPVALRAGRSLDQLEGEAMGEDLVFSESWEQPHWRIVFQLPKATIYQRAAAAFSAQLFLALLLLVGALVVHLVLWRLYVAPALKIASFVARASRNAQARVPTVPSLWQPWLDAMVRAFDDRQRYLAELKQSNDALEQRVARRTQALVDANARLEELAVTDALTGAFNRRHLFDLLDGECLRVARGGLGFSLLMLDLDFFKNVNDSFGHAAGDFVLRDFVVRCQAVVRKTDVVCRYGGEEFVIFMPAMGGLGAAQLAERLRAAVDLSPVMFEGTAIALTVSTGVASYRAGEDLEQILSRADHRLYLAKKAGRNQVVYLD